MKINTLSSYDKKLLYNDFYIKKISFADDKITKLIHGVEAGDKDEIIANLNMINNQNIQDINFEKYQYTHRGNVLGFSELSKAERVFLLATIADKKHKEIWLHTDITQLTKSTLKKLIKLFYNSPYVNIVYDSELSRPFYNAMVKEAIND